MKTGILAKTAMAGLLATSLIILSSSATAADTPRKINIVAKKYSYEPSEITVKKGESVVLELTTSDVSHGLKFKELNLNTKIEKGKTSELVFTPSQTGNFVGHCSIFCGSGHGSMTITLHVTE